jgi:hypothetical protein
MEQSEKTILHSTAATVLQEPVVLEADIHGRTKLHRYLQQKGLAPVKRQLVIRPITLGNLVRISKILLGMDVQGKLDQNNVLESNYQLITDNAHHLAGIVAIAVHNQRSEPPASLVRFIEHHFTSRELQHTVNIVLKQMDLLSFMNTIISVKGLTVMSPKEQGSQIASGEQSEGS